MAEPTNETRLTPDDHLFRVGYLAALDWAVNEVALQVDVTGCGGETIRRLADSFVERMKVPPTLIDIRDQLRRAA